MMLLVSGATKTIKAIGRHDRLGQLLTPANGNTLDSVLATGLPFGVDNAAFSYFDGDAWAALVEQLAGWYRGAVEHERRRLLFVTAPDVVADADATARMFVRYWSTLDMLHRSGMPLAYVLQDGCDPRTRAEGRKRPGGIPWDVIRCLFIGGSTEYKIGPQAARIIGMAKERGLWVHVGRVNSMARIAHFAKLGADSFDGGQFSMFPDTYIQPYLDRLSTNQATFLGDV